MRRFPLSPGDNYREHEIFRISSSTGNILPDNFTVNPDLVPALPSTFAIRDHGSKILTSEDHPIPRSLGNILHKLQCRSGSLAHTNLLAVPVPVFGDELSVTRKWPLRSYFFSRFDQIGLPVHPGPFSVDHPSSSWVV